MKKRIDIEEGTLLVLIVLTLTAIYIKGAGPNSWVVALLSVATFLFGIFGAFIMQDRHKRLDELRRTLREEDALFITIYRLSELFGKNIQSKIQKAIDNYLIETIDYKLKDHSLAHDKFLELYDAVKNLKPKGEMQVQAYSKLLDSINQANKNRRRVEHLAKNKLFAFEWLTLITLLAVILFSMFYINTNSTISIIITVLLSTSAVLFILLLRDLNSLFWKEQKWIWEPVDELFEELNLLPYYPSPLIELKRVKLSKGTKVRIAHYPHPYPDMGGKVIKTTTI